MGMMNKLRENTGVVLWILVIAFGVIWVLQDSGGLDHVGMGGGANVATVNGDAISIEEYNRAIDGQVQAFQQQTGESMPPQMLERERERVFDALVDDRLAEQEMNRLGITVTDDEVYELIRGENPHPLILSYFGDGQGNINEALLESFISNPEARQDWIQIEDFLRQERRREKLQLLVMSSVRVSEPDVRAEYDRQNRRASARWVAVRYADIPAEEVELTDRDVRRFYDQNRSDYRRERTYTLDYVMLSKSPAEEDSLLLLNEMNRLRQEFAQAEDDSLFLVRQGSTRPYTVDWFSADDLAPELASALYENPVAGRLVGPVFAGGSVHLAKIQDVRPASEEMIRARHILLRSSSEDAEVESRLADIRRQIEGGADFASLARRHSEDNTASIGGDLGWFGRGRMVEPFENAAFGASTGQVVGPVRTSFGYHLIEVTDRAEHELQIVDFAQPVVADIGTLSQLQERLEDLRFYADESGDFQEEAERLNMTVETVQVEEDQDVIPVIGQSRTLQQFLSSASRRNISEVIELDDAFMVAYVREIQRAGYRPFEEVVEEVRPRALREVRRDRAVARLSEAAQEGGDLSAISGRLGSQVRSADDITFAGQVVPGLGREPRFVGTVFGLPEGARSNVVAGENAAFIVEVDAIHEPPAMTDSQRQSLERQLLTQRQSQTLNEWFSALRDEANIRDYRSQVFQF